MIISKFRPSWYLATCMVCWGIVSGATGAVQGFGGLVACRFFLGVTEVILNHSFVIVKSPSVFSNAISAGMRTAWLLPDLKTRVVAVLLLFLSMRHLAEAAAA